VVEETTLFIIQKKVCWRVEKLLTKFVDDFEAVDDDRVEVGKDIRKISRVKLSATNRSLFPVTVN
jgi:hypothetical protein